MSESRMHLTNHRRYGCICDACMDELAGRVPDVSMVGKYRAAWAEKDPKRPDDPPRCFCTCDGCAERQVS